MPAELPSVSDVTPTRGMRCAAQSVEEGVLYLVELWLLWSRMQDDLPDFGDDTD